MFDGAEELLAKIRLGEGSVLELKAVRFRDGTLSGPRRDELADELAAMANTAGGVCVLGVDDKSREIEGVPIDRLDAVEQLAREEFAQNLGKADFFLVGEVAGSDDDAQRYRDVLGRNLNATLDIGGSRRVLHAVAKGLAPPADYFNLVALS